MPDAKNMQIHKTPEELKQIAIDIRAGHIWHDRCNKGYGIESFRGILSLCSNGQLKEVQECIAPADFPNGATAGLVYAYLKEGENWSVNGMPTFLTFSVLTAAEMNIVKEYYDKLDAAEKSVEI